jgi:hypothetical protein
MVIVRETTEPLAEELDAELRAFNQQRAGPLHREQLAVAIRDGERLGERLLAGLSGELFWNALYVHALWVAEQRRHQGVVAHC